MPPRSSSSVVEPRSLDRFGDLGLDESCTIETRTTKAKEDASPRREVTDLACEGIRMINPVQSRLILSPPWNATKWQMLGSHPTPE